MTAIEDAYKKAVEEKSNDIRNYVWKGPKVNGIQEEIRLIDANYDQLRRFYKHCMEMLYNNNAKNPGRITLLSIVKDQIQRCRAELLIRWLKAEKSYPATSCLEDLKNIIATNSELTEEVIKTYPIDMVMNGLPEEFGRVPIGTLMKACLSSLGVLDSSHLTLSFIVKMGLCFTQQEMQKDLYRKDETGKTIKRLEVIRKEFGLDPRFNPWINFEGGLSYNEFKTMYIFKTGKINSVVPSRYASNKVPYSDMTSDLLRLLSNKVLYRFQELCEKQAKQWQDKVDELIRVAEYKGWDITRNIE